MLSDVYRQKMAENLEKMIEIKRAMPKTHKKDHEYKRMAEENRHYETQINRYKNLLGNGTSTSKAE